MHKVFFLAITLLLMVSEFVFRPVVSTRERVAILCHPTEMPDDMEAFASDPAFQALHLSPLTINYQVQGEMIKYPVELVPKPVRTLLKRRKNQTNGYSSTRNGGD